MSAFQRSAVDDIVRGRLTQYEEDRPGLVRALNRAGNALKATFGSDGFKLASLGVGGAGTLLGVGGLIVAGAGVAPAVAAAGVAMVVPGLATGIAGLTGALASKLSSGNGGEARDWADNMRKLDRLMGKAEEKGVDRSVWSDPATARKLEDMRRMSWLQRKLSPIPKEMFAVADQKWKLDTGYYQGITNMERKEPTRQIGRARIAMNPVKADDGSFAKPSRDDGVKFSI